MSQLTTSFPHSLHVVPLNQDGWDPAAEFQLMKTKPVVKTIDDENHLETDGVMVVQIRIHLWSWWGYQSHFFYYRTNAIFSSHWLYNVPLDQDGEDPARLFPGVNTSEFDTILLKVHSVEITYNWCWIKIPWDNGLQPRTKTLCLN